MRDHILDEGMLSSGPEKIWRHDQHAGRGYRLFRFRYAHSDTGPAQDFQPYLLGANTGLRWTADLCSEQQIVVIGTPLREWRGRFRSSEEQFYCSTTRSTGDAESDAIGCTTAAICYQRSEPRLSAAFDRSRPRSARRAAKKVVEDELTACHRAERRRLIAALSERRGQ